MRVHSESLGGPRYRRPEIETSFRPRRNHDNNGDTKALVFADVIPPPVDCKPKGEGLEATLLSVWGNAESPPRLLMEKKAEKEDRLAIRPPGDVEGGGGRRRLGDHSSPVEAAGGGLGFVGGKYCKKCNVHTRR